MRFGESWICEDWLQVVMGKLEALSWYSMTPGLGYEGLPVALWKTIGLRRGQAGPSYVHLPSPLCPHLLGPGRQVEGHMTSLKVLGHVFLKGFPGLVSLIMNRIA